MRHPENGSFYAVSLSIVAVFVLSTGLIKTDEIAAISKGDRYFQAVYDYVNKTCANLDETQRDEITKGGLVREIKDWPLQSRIRHHRLFVFPRGASFNRGAVLVAVANDLIPFETYDARDVNELIQKEGIRILEPQVARELAEFFLKSHGVSNVFDYGYDSGLNVIRSLNDIPFNKPEEKSALEKAFKIEPPRVIARNDSFRYVLYSWDKFNTGRLEQQEVVMDSRGIRGFKTALLKAGVGKWEAYR